MSKPTKKPLTHCEKYGHTWATGTANGFDVCTHVSYVQGKTVRCQAVRRKPGTESRSVRVAVQTSSAVQPVTQQEALWG